MVGLSAGASAPPRLVDEVVEALGAWDVRVRETARETVQFTLPVAVRAPGRPEAD